MDNPPDAETIRLKRLARLGASLKGASESTASPTSSDSRPQSQAPSASPTTYSSTTSAVQPLPSLKRPVSPSAGQPIDHARGKPSQRDSNPRAPPSLSLEQWENDTVARAFRVTVQEQPSTEGYLYLSDLSDEIKAQGRELRLGLQDLDQIIISAASIAAQPFAFLRDSHRRILSMAHRPPNPRLDVAYQTKFLAELRRICVDFCGHALVEPDIFDASSRPFNLAEDLLKVSDGEPAISSELINDLAETFTGNPDLEGVFLKAFGDMSAGLKHLELVDDYQIYTNALYRLVTIKPMAILFTASPSFLPSNLRPPDFEVETLLGPYFRISPLQGRVVETYFPSPKTQAPAALNLASSSLRISIKTYQDQLSVIVNYLVRASPEARGRVLDFFASVLNSNSKRRALQVQENTVSSDGFLLNITAVLNKLCDPFMDATYSKVDKIDVRYFRQSPRVDIKNETKIYADQATSDAFYESTIEGKANFNSEVFFLNVAAHHVGYIACINNAVNLSHEICGLRHAKSRRGVCTPQISIP